MKYKIKRKPKLKITQFYQNVIRKYRHTYSVVMMHKNVETAINDIFQIEQTLLRRRPTLERWQQEGWHMAHSGKWYYAYSITDDTIIIEDACHEQNMFGTIE